MPDDESTYIANGRIGSFVSNNDNNESSVVSGMTDGSRETPSSFSSSMPSVVTSSSQVVAHNRDHAHDAADTAGRSSRDGGGLVVPRGRRDGHQGRRPPFDAIVEGGGEGEGDDDDDEDAAPYGGRRFGGDDAARPSSDYPAPILPDGGGSSSTSSSSSSSQHHRRDGDDVVRHERRRRQQRGGGGGGGGGGYDDRDQDEDGVMGITGNMRQSILLAAYDSSRLPTHNPKMYATREVDVSNYQDIMNESDEMSSVPVEYYPHDEYGNRIRHSHGFMVGGMTSSYAESSSSSPRGTDDDIALLSSSTSVSIPPSWRRWSSLLTILSAVILAVVGICLSVQSLSTFDDAPDHEHLDGSSSSVPSSTAAFPRFGGGVGGLLSGGGGGRLDRDDRLLSSSYRDDGVGGGYDAPAATTAMTTHQTRGVRSGGLAILTSTPLTSYVPPLDNRYEEAIGTTVRLDPGLDRAFVDLSTLPYDPRVEMPVVWDVFLSDGGSTIEAVFGNCLRLVQCTGQGAEILSRERELEAEGRTDVIGGSGNLGGRRSLMTLVPRVDEAAPIASIADNANSFITLRSASVRDVETTAAVPNTPHPPPPPHPAFFDPPLRAEVFYTSTYVNVDCATTRGVDRGVSHDLAASGMSDVIHSPDFHDAARLFWSTSPTDMRMYGRAVVMLRNPIELSVARYERLRFEDGDVGDMSLEEFARSDHLPDNIFTRKLANKNDSYILGVNDLAIAKEILSRKFVIGIYENLEDSIRRFETFFGWNHGTDRVNSSHDTCRHEVVTRAMRSHYNVNAALPPDGSSAHMALSEKNALDLELYDFARFLYNYQGRVLFGNTV